MYTVLGINIATYEMEISLLCVNIFFFLGEAKNLDKPYDICNELSNNYY